MQAKEVHEYFSKMEIEELQYWKGAIESQLIQRSIANQNKNERY